MKRTLFCQLAIGILIVGQVGAASQKKNLGISDPIIKVERGSAHRLFILGFVGQLVVTPSPKKSNEISYRLTKYLDPMNPSSSDEKNESLRMLSVRTSTSADTLELRVVSSLNRSDWLKWVDVKRAPLAKLEIQAPDNMNVEIYWMHGEVKVSNWNGAVSVIAQDGHQSIDEVDGDLSLKSMFGSAHVNNIHGSVTLEGFTDSINASGITGKLTLKTFASDVKLKKIVGAINLSAQKSSVTTQDTNGAMTLQNGAASMHIKDHRGSIGGASESGLIDASIVGPVNAKLASVSGPLILRVPRSSEAHVSLSTEKGNLNAPSSVESKKSANGKSARGHLEGKEPGFLRLTSESGDISLKFL